MTDTTVFIASDHGGLTLKRLVAQHLASRGVTVVDLGPDSDASCNYPDYAGAVCRKVLSGEGRGILVCGTGLGMSMAANRFRGIRAALCHNEFSARMSKAHNDANILCLGERVLGPGMALGIVDAFMDTPFEAGRHATRIALFDEPGYPA